jgi:type IV pilus assembly protein PilC
MAIDQSVQVDEPAPLPPPSQTPPPAPASPPGALSRVLHFEITPKKVPRRELMHFSRQMAVFIRAGIPILEALDSITEEMANKKFKQVLDDVGQRLRAGQTFADSAAVHPEAFPDFYIGILRSAELTGNLDDVLDRLSDYIDRDLAARRRITGALTYPIAVLALSVVVVVVLTAFVLPRFETFFASLHAKLPLPTRILLDISHFITHRWYVLAAIGLVLLLVVIWMFRSTRGRATRDRLVLRLPVVGELVRLAILERFCRILSSMVVSGVPLPQALAVTTEAVHNDVYKRGLRDVQQAMVRGEGLATPLAETGLFPSAARQMFRVGEATGTLDDQLETAATFFDRELEFKLKRFADLFEPAVIISVGLVVGFVAIALVSAMYGIFRQVHV